MVISDSLFYIFSFLKESDMKLLADYLNVVYIPRWNKGEKESEKPKTDFMSPRTKEIITDTVHNTIKANPNAGLNLNNIRNIVTNISITPFVWLAGGNIAPTYIKQYKETVNGQ